MDNYKDLLADIFATTKKDSITCSRTDYTMEGFNFADFNIKFTHVKLDEEQANEVYEKIRQLIRMIVEDVKNNR